MTTIDELRQQIDAIDEELIKLLGRRRDVAQKIGEIKKEHNIEILDEKRWETVLEKAMQKAETIYLDANFVKKIFETIHEYSQKIQKK